MSVTARRSVDLKAPFAAQPAPPVRQFSFTDFQTNNPTAPPPGDRLDAEFDRADKAVADTIAWAGTSLNTDGSLRDGSVGQNQLEPGLFDDVAEDIIAEVQPFVADAEAAASAASASAATAHADATTASSQAASAAGSASSAGASAATATSANTNAQAAATAAANAGDAAANSANHAAGDAALAEDWGIVSQAWAEHMPDTIPPNILAVMGITGDHWSSRWWANHASGEISDGLEEINDAGEYWLGILQDQTEDAIQGIQSLYLGAFVSPPTADSLGNPIAVGAMYFDITLDAAYVWNGSSWRPLVTPGPEATFRYIYVATAGQTVFTGPDRDGNTLLYDAANLQTLSVYKKGLLLTPVNDYTEAVNRVTLAVGAAAGDIVQIKVGTVPTVDLAWNTARLDTSTWTSTTGVLKDFQGHTLTPNSPADVMLSVDGVWQQAVKDYTLAGSTITFTTPLQTGFKVFGLAIIPSVTTQVPVPGLTVVDTAFWIFDGVTKTFPIKDGGGVAISPQTSVNLLVSINGIWQAAETDYTVAGSNVTFTVAPEADAQKFAVAGLPALMTTG